MGRPSRPYKTFHISVPVGDEEIMEWLSKQYNQSSSVRELIRLAAREIGMVDLFIGSPAQRAPGVRGRSRQPILPVDPAVLEPYRPGAPISEPASPEPFAGDDSVRPTDRGDSRRSRGSRKIMPPVTEADHRPDNLSHPSQHYPQSGGIRIDPSVLGEASGRSSSGSAKRSENATEDGLSGTPSSTADRAEKERDVLQNLRDMMDS